MRHPRPPPLPLSSPSPTPRGGTLSNTGAQLRMRIFTPKTEKRRGALFKNGKNSRGGTRFERGGVTGKFWERENSGGGTRFGRGFTGKIFKNGKSRRGVPVLEGGLPGSFEEREKRRLEPVKTGKNAGGGTLLEGGLPEQFGRKKILYYICGKE